MSFADVLKVPGQVSAAFGADWRTRVSSALTTDRADGSAEFRVPGAAVTLSLNSDPGEPVALTTVGGVMIGATSFTVEDVRGGIQGTVTQGAAITIGAETVVSTKTVNAKLGKITVQFSPALTSPYIAGSPVAISASVLVVDHVVTVSERRAKVDFASEGITFAFHFNRDDAGFLPQKGWLVTATTRHGARSGTVKNVDHTGVQVTVHAGD